MATEPLPVTMMIGTMIGPMAIGQTKIDSKAGLRAIDSEGFALRAADQSEEEVKSARATGWWC